MVEVGQMVVVAKADMGSINMAMNTLTGALGKTDTAVKHTIGNFSFLGSVLTGVVMAGTGMLVQGLMKITKGVFDLAMVSPEARVAMAGLQMEMMRIGMEAGPAVGEVIVGLTHLFSALWDVGGETIINLIKGFADLAEVVAQVIPMLGPAWEVATERGEFETAFGIARGRMGGKLTEAGMMSWIGLAQRGDTTIGEMITTEVRKGTMTEAQSQALFKAFKELLEWLEAERKYRESVNNRGG